MPGSSRRVGADTELHAGAPAAAVPHHHGVPGLSPKFVAAGKVGEAENRSEGLPFGVAQRTRELRTSVEDAAHSDIG